MRLIIRSLSLIGIKSIDFIYSPSNPSHFICSFIYFIFVVFFGSSKRIPRIITHARTKNKERTRDLMRFDNLSISLGQKGERFYNQVTNFMLVIRIQYPSIYSQRIHEEKKTQNSEIQIRNQSGQCQNIVAIDNSKKPIDKLTDPTFCWSSYQKTGIACRLLYKRLSTTLYYLLTEA